MHNRPIFPSPHGNGGCPLTDIDQAEMDRDALRRDQYENLDTAPDQSEGQGEEEF